VPVLEALILAAVVFASTNVDDILVLSVFFAQPGRRVWAIVVGQYLGIGVLVLTSVAAALAALVIPREWIALIGVVPLALGIKQLVAGSNHRAGQPQTGAGALTVAAVTAANGGDNLGVYIPLFATRPAAIPMYAGVFAIGTAVWCLAAYALVSHPVLAATFTRYGHRVLPWVLIGVGVYVLWGAAPVVRL
jgi:cadmium resistance protein CadD (predicted permease)